MHKFKAVINDLSHWISGISFIYTPFRLWCTMFGVDALNSIGVNMPSIHILKVIFVLIASENCSFSFSLLLLYQGMPTISRYFQSQHSGSLLKVEHASTSKLSESSSLSGNVFTSQCALFPFAFHFYSSLSFTWSCSTEHGV